MNDQKDISEVWDFIKNNKLVVFSTISTEKKSPESSLLYYFFDENKVIYLATSQDSRKLKNIEENNNVALLIKHDTEAIVLQIQGTAKIIQKDSVKAEVLDNIASIANSNSESAYFPPVLTLTQNSGMEFIEISIIWFKYSNFETHFPCVIEGNLEKWEKKILSH